MGHDITAIRKSSTKELSYIRIGAWNRHKAYMLYEALNAHNCNGGVSGNGREREFTPDESKIYFCVTHSRHDKVRRFSCRPVGTPINTPTAEGYTYF